MGRDLHRIIDGMEVISTHSHHLKDTEFAGFDLDRLLRRTYVGWSGVTFDDTITSKQRYLDKVRYKSYFVWLHRAIKALYGISEDLTPGTWALFSERIRAAHAGADWHKAILKDRCNYSKVILDSYWAPGSDNGHPDIFAPAFRVDPLFFGYSSQAVDHDRNNVRSMYGREFADLDTFNGFVRDLVTENVRSGSVCIKNAIAYDRTVDYRETTKDKAAKAFRSGASAEDIRHFQDYLFYDICALAAELDVPVQCHTGLGCLDGTRAIGLREIIQKNPDTKFILFHASFPWTNDVLALLHNFPNVYVDICWLPLLSPTAAVQTLHQLIEVGTADRMCWGCDTWTSEESFGARLAINSVLAEVLDAKMNSGYLNAEGTEQVARNILFNNAKTLYKL